MNIDLIAKIAGALGLLISIATFIVTRLERRKRIEIEIFHGYESDIEEYDVKSRDHEIEIIKVRLTNLGSRPVILKPETLEIRCGGKIYRIDKYNFGGREGFEELMPPLSKREVGLPLSETIAELGIKTPDKYDEKSFNKTYPLVVTIKDHEGSAFKCAKYSFQESIGEFVT